MREAPSELNPYASPAADVREAAAVRRRFRWRVIPVAILCVFGAPLLVGMVVLLGFSVWWRIRNPDAMDLGVGPTVPMLAGYLFGLIAAALCLLTARRLWQGRWWSAVAAFSVAIFLFFLFSRLAGLE